jgi:hypothetical protein
VISYLVEAIPADKLNHVEQCDGFRCRRHAKHDDLCHSMIDQAFVFAGEPSHHLFDAWGNDEAIRVAICWLASEHGESAVGRLRERTASKYIAYLHGLQEVAP